MILRRYQSLGSLPEWIAGIALLGIVSIFGAVYWKVASRPPVAIVPGASGCQAAEPAIPDQAYAEAFTRHFLVHWLVWNEYTYGYRRSLAIGLMAAEVQNRFRVLATDSSRLVNSMNQSQTIEMDTVTAKPGGPNGNVWIVNFTGKIKSYYGGVGGQPDPMDGALLLTRIMPTPTNPMCLEVRGLKIHTPEGGRSIGTILGIADDQTPLPTPNQPAPAPAPAAPAPPTEKP